MDTPSEPPAAEAPAKARASRLGVAVAAAVAVLAVVETSVALVAPSRAPKDADWEAAARELRAGFHAGDLIVAAPAWSDPIMRLHLGDLVPVELAARFDDVRFARVWELSQRGAHAPEARGAVAFERSFGALTLRRVERAAPTIAYDFQQRWTEARVVRASGGRETPCPWAVDRFQCPDIGFNFVHLQTVEVDLTLHRGLLTQPVGGAEVVVEYAAVPLGRELVIATGMHDVWARKAGDGAVELRVYLDDAAGPTGTAVVAPSAPVAAITTKNESGWLMTHIDTAARMGRATRVRFVVTSQAPYQRQFVFAAEARQ
ncbi:MAG: hypothetical protein JWM82_446 [Myxococcales bacterium]|nr:hypothetical protein [Myxococcales bacterium]